jgi:hypothetical protein
LGDRHHGNGGLNGLRAFTAVDHHAEEQAEQSDADGKSGS